MTMMMLKSQGFLGDVIYGWSLGDQNLKLLNPSNKETDFFTELKTSRFNNPKNLIMGHLNISWLRNWIYKTNHQPKFWFVFSFVNKVRWIFSKQSMLYKRLLDV